MQDSTLPLLKVEGLRVQYGAVQAIREASLRVGHGEFVAVIGNNGAGKTSLLRGITGLVRPLAGSVRFEGADTTATAPHHKVRKGIVMVPEGRLIFADQTVRDNLVLGALAHGGERSSTFAEDLERTLDVFPRLQERLAQQAGTLSGGEQQMLAIARGLMSRPRILLIDELSLGLAPKVVEQLLEVLLTLNRQGLAILLVEQLAALALSVTDRTYVVANGRIVRTGPSADLVRDPGMVETFLGKRRRMV